VKERQQKKKGENTKRKNSLFYGNHGGDVFGFRWLAKSCVRTKDVQAK